MIGVGLIGYGYAGRVFHAPLIGSVDGLELRAIASSRPAAVLADDPRMRVVSDPADLLADPSIELIVVATPNDTHAGWTRAGLEAGKHVVVEKPCVVDAADARPLVALAHERRRMLAVFHNRRWDSDYLSVQRALEAGAVGRVVHFESHIDRFRPEVRRRWREGTGPGAGIWYDLGPHLVDQALQLFGVPHAVSASLASLRDGGQSDDWAHVLLHYPDKRVILHASMVVAGGASRFVVHGTRGSLLKRGADPQEAQLLAGVRPASAHWGVDSDALLRWDAHGEASQSAASAGDQRQFYLRVVAAIREGAPSPTPAHEVLGVTAVIEAALHASRGGHLENPDLGCEERAAWPASLVG